MLDYSLPYLLVIIAYLILGYLEIRFARKKRAIQVIECLLFILFFGLRGNIGTDWINYQEYYTTKSQWNFTRYEPGFCMLANLSSAVNLNYSSWIFVISILQGFLFDFYFSKKVKYMSLAYIVLISFYPNLVIDTLRNFISILFGMISLDEWSNNQKRSAIVFVVLSILFHTTGLVFILLFPLTRFYLNKKLVLFLFICGLAVYFLRIEYIKPIISTIGNVLGGSYSVMANLYLETDATSSSYGISIGILEKILFFILLFLRYDYVVQHNIFDKYIFNLFILYVLAQFYFSEMSILITRFAIILFAGYLIILTSLTQIYHLKSNRVIFSIFLIILCLIKASISYNAKIYDYSNVVFHQDDINERKYYVRMHYL